MTSMQRKPRSCCERCCHNTCWIVLRCKKRLNAVQTPGWPQHSEQGPARTSTSLHTIHQLACHAQLALGTLLHHMYLLRTDHVCSHIALPCPVVSAHRNMQQSYQENCHVFSFMQAAGFSWAGKGKVMQQDPLQTSHQCDVKEKTADAGNNRGGGSRIVSLPADILNISTWMSLAVDAFVHCMCN